MLDKRKVKKARQDRKMTQVEIADLCNMEKETISRFESGERSNITLETLDRLAKALKVKPAELLK